MSLGGVVYLSRAFYFSLTFMLGCTSAVAQNTNDIVNIFGGLIKSAIVQTTLAEWKKLPQDELACVDQNLRQQGLSLPTAIQQGIMPSDPRIADARSACRTQVAGQPTQGPSFDCKKARAPDELAICSDTELSRLDNLVVSGYNYLRSRYGARFAESIGDPLWRARHACGADVSCIKQKQLSAIDEYKTRGAPITAPEPFVTRRIDKSIYVVDGLALGGRVVFDSQSYRDYQCAPSEQFAGLTWCKKRRQENDPRGQFTSSYSILHAENGVALYINRWSLS
jgi:hypothetical protein